MIQSHQAKDEKERGETFILEKKKGEIFMLVFMQILTR